MLRRLAIALLLQPSGNELEDFPFPVGKSIER
jgi:hypothetical protein